jgi:hypothetical protein
MGNFEGTDTGMLPFDSDGDGIPDMEIPFSLPNHVGYSSEVNMVFNAGGALPEISWLEEGEVPIASMQNISDPDAPYAEGNVIVPTTGEFVIVAHGSQLIQEIADSLGNNDVFLELSTTITDAWYANGNGAENAEVAGHDNLSGLFGVITPAPSTTPTVCGLEAVQNAPWDWWDNVAYTTSADVYHDQLPGTMGCLALLSNPDMSEEKGLAFANMLSEFFTPRVFAALNVDGTIESPILNAEELEFFDLSIFPNPAKNELRISTDTEISSYELYDLTGKLIFNNMNVNSKSTTIYRNELNSGLYLTKITDINGNGIIRKIIFE